MDHFLTNKRNISVPEFLMHELTKYGYMFLHQKHVDIRPQIHQLLEKVHIIPQSVHTKESESIRSRMAHIDPKDTDFVACAMHLQAPLRTNDKKLITHVDRIDTYSTDDMIKKFYPSHTH